MIYNPLQVRFNVSDNSPPAIVHFPGMYLIGRDSDSNRVSVKLHMGATRWDPADLEQFNWLLGGQAIGYDRSVSRNHADFTLDANGVRFNSQLRSPTFYKGEHGYYELESKILVPGNHELKLGNMPLFVTVEPYSRDRVESLPGFPHKQKPRNKLSRIWEDILRGIKDA
jgi:hypothetical protein